MKQKSELLQKYNDKLSGVYDKVSHKPEFNWQAPDEVNKLLLPICKLGYKVLDVGIGTGQSTEKLYQIGCKITGIDISQKMLDVTCKKFPDWHLYKADIEKEFPVLEKESFDIIIATGIFEFVVNLEKVIRKVYKLLKPTGIFCFTFEEYLPEHKLQHLKKSELGRGIKSPLSKSVSFYVYRHSLAEVLNILQNTKFKVLKEKQFTSYFKTGKKIPVIYRIVLAKKVRTQFYRCS
jgi:ubiquinone/menaquinone biosynthesis C-methylase UbiE